MLTYADATRMLPLLTYAGVKMAARVAASLNRAAHAEVYTARTLGEYVQTAVRLARNAPRGEQLRQVYLSLLALLE